jgi:hypothetical protein
MTPRWLTRTLVGVVATVATLAVFWSVSCTVAGFMGLKHASSKDCESHDDRAIQTLMALTATLISLQSNPPNRE